MKKSTIITFFCLLIVPMTAGASEVFVYVDAAPNVYGSPDYDPWLAAAYEAVANGTFINMQSSINLCNYGILKFEIEDEVVYSFGDLGKRLTWFYWIPGETIETITGNFEIALYNTWDGDLLDFYGDYYGQTWLEPTRWEDYDADGDGVPDGVIGTAGMAWWGAYGVNTPEALEADLAEWGTARESWEFLAKYDGEITSLVSSRLPVRVTTLYAECADGARNHGAFVRCVSEALNELKKDGIITGREKGVIQSCAGQSVLP